MANKQRKHTTPRPGGAKPHDPKPGPAVKETPAAGVDQRLLSESKAKAPAGDRQRMTARQRYQRQQQQQRWIRMGMGAVGLVVVALAIWGIYNWNQDQSLNAAPDNVQNFSYTGNQHTNDPVTYTENPPVGGPHNPYWQNCGFYAQPVHNENAVHSLEHGAVWITYRPDLPQDQIDQLKKIAEGQDYILVSPYPDLPAPVVASSWNHQIKLTSASDENLMRFIRNYKQGKDTPEPGAACSGGTSATVQG